MWPQLHSHSYVGQVSHTEGGEEGGGGQSLGTVTLDSRTDNGFIGFDSGTLVQCSQVVEWSCGAVCQLAAACWSTVSNRDPRTALHCWHGQTTSVHLTCYMLCGTRFKTVVSTYIGRV